MVHQFRIYQTLQFIQTLVKSDFIHQIQNQLKYICACINMFIGSKATLYKSFCLLITIVYFASIVYNILYADVVPEDLDQDENNQEPERQKKHRKDLSMTEYVQLRLLDLSHKPWNQVLQSPLFRNYLILFTLLLLMSISFFIHALYSSRNSTKNVQHW